MRTRCSALGFRLFSLVALCSAITACVGPTTPFGAIDSFWGAQTTNLQLKDDESSSPVKITFKPRKQVLHDKSDFVVEIYDQKKIPNIEDVKIFFNSIEVTKQFLSKVETKKILKDKKLQINFKNLRLKTLDENHIQVAYQTDGQLYASPFSAPHCDLFDSKAINNIQGFQPPNEYLLWLSEIAKQNKINPNFLTGIVAQESGFNPRAISWAKAVGLTQMTDIAQEQIRVDEKNWPRRRDISSLNYLELRSKVNKGEITPETEWRLDPQKSLQGGAEYIHYLQKYWSSEENSQWLKKLSGDPNLVLSKVILASYNSGPLRVKNSIISEGENWIKKTEMTEARKYIKKVFSYCYHFSERSVTDDG